MIVTPIDAFVMDFESSEMKEPAKPMRQNDEKRCQVETDTVRLQQSLKPNRRKVRLIRAMIAKLVPRISRSASCSSFPIFERVVILAISGFKTFDQISGCDADKAGARFPTL